MGNANGGKVSPENVAKGRSADQVKDIAVTAMRINYNNIKEGFMTCPKYLSLRYPGL